MLLKTDPSNLRTSSRRTSALCGQARASALPCLLHRSQSDFLHARVQQPTVSVSQTLDYDLGYIVGILRQVEMTLFSWQKYNPHTEVKHLQTENGLCNLALAKTRSLFKRTIFGTRDTEKHRLIVLAFLGPRARALNLYSVHSRAK